MKCRAWATALVGLVSAQAGGAVAAPGTSVPARPLPATGSNTVTRVFHTNTRAPYALGDHLEMLRMQLLRVRTRVEMVPISPGAGERLGNADYVVVFCPQYFPNLPRQFLEALAACEKPVLWVGYGIDQLQSLGPFEGAFEASPYPTGEKAAVLHYRGMDWPVSLDPWIPVALKDGTRSEVIMSMSVPDAAAPSRPVCWRTGRVTFLATVPVFGALGFLFSDLLLEFYGANPTAPPHLYLRIEAYHCRRDHDHFRRMVDYLHARGRPFLVAVIPAYRDPVTDQVEGLDSNPAFVAALRYAQGRGGRLLMHGSVHAHRNEPGAGHEFWDVDLDRPIPGLTGAEVRRRLVQGVEQMLEHGLFPLAWETPHYAASREAYEEIARVFSTAVERVQVSDATYLENFEAAGLTRDPYGRMIVPENLGFVLDAREGSFDGIVSMANVITRVRGSVGGCFIHPYQPLYKLAGVIEALESFERPFLDLADLDHWVRVPDALLLVGDASREVRLENTVIHWQAFDRSGNLIREEVDPLPFSGVRTLRRRGAGEFELFRFTKGPP